jgi:hypothetical protein
VQDAPLAVTSRRGRAMQQQRPQNENVARGHRARDVPLKGDLSNLAVRHDAISVAAWNNAQRASITVG